MRRSFYILVLTATLARAGGGPQNVLVVVNDNSAQSLELGEYYKDARGIPERNIFHIATTTNTSIDTAGFSNEIRGPVTNYIAVSGLSSQINYVVFSRDIPYRVSQGGSSNSLTSAMFYGFKTNDEPVCSTPTNFSRSDYYEAERAFTHAGTPSSNRYYLAAMLVSTNTDSAKRLVDHGAAADDTQPTGTVYLFHTPDARHEQWFQFEEADFLARFTAAPQTRQLLDGYHIAGVSNAIGIMAGQCCSLPFQQNTYAPGAIADHFTSYGGVLYDTPGQQSILGWIDAGCVGSYGTIVEPCVFTQKFPNASVHYWYARGFDMAESYYMSVHDPYEGVVVGDPLCAPYAKPPSVAVFGLTNGQVVSGTMALSATGTLSDAQARLDRIDLLLDGVFVKTVTNAAPASGNQASITVNGSTYSHTVLPGQDIYKVASALALLVNADTGVSAHATGDRVEIKQRALGVAGTGITYSAGSAIGIGSDLTVNARAAGSNFAETIEAPIEGVTLSGIAVSGDVVRAVVTRIDGGVFTNDAVATTNGTTALQLLTNLYDAVNADANLQSVSGCHMAYLWDPANFGEPSPPEAYFVARTNAWLGRSLFLQYSVITNTGSTLVGPGFSDNFNDNDATLTARGEVFISAGHNPLPAAYSLTTTNLPDGPHSLTAVAFDGGGLKTQGRTSVVFVVDNNSLTCTVTRPANGQNVLRGSVITAAVSAAGGTVTQVSLFVEGKLFAATSTPPYTWTWATTNLGAGAIGLQARADASTGSVLSDERFVTLYSDDDGDGVSDQWEYRHFGSAATWGATNDPDGDGVDNLAEYLADTQPTNGANYFHETTFGRSTTADAFRVTFASGTTRVYHVDVNTAALTNDAGWIEATNLSRGLSGSTTWEAAGPNTASFYRIRAELP